MQSGERGRAGSRAERVENIELGGEGSKANDTWVVGKRVT
jgi:hypothetical protein